MSTEYPCTLCGGLDKIEYRNLRPGLCFSCNYWHDQAEDKEGVLIDDTWTHRRHNGMQTGHGRAFRGHGGRLFTFIMTDGVVVQSNDVWYQGVIPEHLRHLFTQNCELISE